MVGRRLALVIGNNYPNSDLQLKFAVADAIKIKEVLENKNICGFDVDLLINETKEVVSTKLDTLFANVHQEDLIVIYFSGHGKTSSDNKKLYLFFKDTNKTLFKSSALPFDFINDCLRSPSALKASVVIVLDCCYSGTAGIRGPELDVMEALEKPSGPGTVILTSTGLTGSSTAKEEEKLGHGIFTYYLIEGLEKGNADRDGNGYISIDEWYSYAFYKTKNSSSQLPEKKGSIQGEIYIGMNLPVIRKNEYELKKKKLLDEFSDQLPRRILSISQTILRKDYEKSSMEKADITILGHLESLLQEDLLSEKPSDAIQNYIEVVQHLKGISINDCQKKWKEEEAKQKQEERLEKETRDKEEQERLRKQREEEFQRQREEEEKAKKEAKEKAIKEKEEQERLHQQQEEAEKLEESKRKAQEEIDKRKKEEEKKKQEKFQRQREEAEQNREITKEVSVSSGKIQVKEKAGSYIKYAKIFWSVLVVVLALVAAAYLGSYGDHATPAPATPISLASFNTNTTSGHAPLDVQFTTLSENTTLVNWDFGDGNTSIEQNPKHTYFTPGRYIVNLTASNGNITDSTLTTIDVSVEPFVYIFNGADPVSVIDMATDNVVATIEVGLKDQESVVVTPDGSKIYMAKFSNISTGNSTDISVIDTATNTITANVFVGSHPWRLAVTPDGTKVYLTNSNEDFNPFPDTVSVIDTATDTIVSRVNIGSQPCDVAFTPNGKKAYVTDWNNNVSVIDTATNTITDTLNIDSATDQDLFKVKISPDGKKAYLINECGDTVYIIDTTTNTIIATVTAGRVLSGVITPDGTKVYVAGYLDNNVSVIDTAANTIIATMNVGKGPYAIAVTPDGKKVYVANRYSNSVSAIDTETNRVTATVSVGEEPCDVAIAPDGKKVYVPNYNDGTCSVINTSTDTVTTTVPVGRNPTASIIR